MISREMFKTVIVHGSLTVSVTTTFWYFPLIGSSDFVQVEGDLDIWKEPGVSLWPPTSAFVQVEGGLNMVFNLTTPEVAIGFHRTVVRLVISMMIDLARAST